MAGVQIERAAQSMATEMRILYVNIGFLPANAWGGPVKIVYQNARELQKRGHKVVICASNLFDKHSRIGHSSFERPVDGLRVVYLNTFLISGWPGTLGPTLLSPGALRWLWREVKNCDLVHVNGIRNALCTTAIYFARRQGKPLVLQPHGTLPHLVSSRRLKWLFDSLILSYLLDSISVFVAAQNSEVRQIIGSGAPPELVRVVPNGLPNSNGVVSSGRFRAAFSIPEGWSIILFLARINHKKGADLLVEAYARMPVATRDKTILVIAGPDDGQLDLVRSLVAKHALEDQVVFTGLLANDDVPYAHRDANIFVLPCRVDTFPMAIIEACQASTPMVVTETCGIAHILDNKSATVVPVDVEAIATAMDLLLTDHDLQRRYKKGASELMKTVFSIEAVGDSLEMVYDDAIALHADQ